MANELVNKQTNRRLPRGRGTASGSVIVSGTKAARTGPERADQYCVSHSVLGLYCRLATDFHCWKLPAGRWRKLMTNKHLSRPSDQKQTRKTEKQRTKIWKNGTGDINILHVLLAHPFPWVCVCLGVLASVFVGVPLCVFFHAIFENEKTKVCQGVQNRTVNAFWLHAQWP